ncbi:hypothetical protein K458DRAFT_395883 [Lentithecium fluviatile CBS 122367]|uniref:Uncharacterized protein n=1 Tax=Lentithecium fluviatile CBS 122367 TaxID=1168545 RepID=A0A6G1IHL0_9PLEO|nr:hypothetical protein K458DRAFT_395883 [Lentithecium fluviatile CBS 122367]
MADDSEHIGRAPQPPHLLPQWADGGRLDAEALNNRQQRPPTVANILHGDIAHRTPTARAAMSDAAGRNGETVAVDHDCAKVYPSCLKFRPLAIQTECEFLAPLLALREATPWRRRRLGKSRRCRRSRIVPKGHTNIDGTEAALDLSILCPWRVFFF